MWFDRNDHPMAPRCWERAPSTTSDSVIRRCRLDVRFARKRKRSAPALSERRHPRFAGRLIAVCRAFDVAVVAARPHPGAIPRRSRRQEDAADDDAILQDIIVIIAPQPYEREADPRLRISEAEEVLPVNRHPLTAS